VRFARTQKAITFLLAGVAALPLALSGEVGAEFAAGLALLGAAGWFLEPPLTRDPRFRRAVAALMLVLLAVQAARVAAGAPVARAGMEYALILQGLKLASRGGAGDYQQIVILAFLHVIAATIATFDLEYAVAFVAFVALSAPALTLAHLRQEMERRFRRDDGPESRRAMERLLASRRVVSPAFLAGTALFAVPVLAFTAVLFLSFPRFGLGFLGRLPGPGGLAGFSGEVRIGDLEETRRDGSVVLRLEPLDPDGPRPGRLPLKLRGAVFEVYEDGVWKRGEPGRFRPMRRRGDDHALDRDRREVAGTAGFDVLLESIEPSYLFLPRGTALITTVPVARQGVMKPRTIEIDARGVVRYEDEARVGLRYRVRLEGRETDAAWAIGAAGHAGGDPALERAYLAVPPGLEELPALARELAGDGAPRERAASLERGLRAGWRYADALPPGAGPGEGATPLHRFLFSRGTGTCEHFATALTLMLRAEGIPARLCTGFGSVEWNRVGGYYAARLSSAHAWTEARLDGRWVTLDATPAREGGGGPAEPSTLALLLDALRMRWHKHVVGFDAASQVDLARGLSRLLPASGGGPDLPRTAIRTLLMLLAGAALLWAGLALRRRLRRRGPRNPRGRRAAGSAAARTATRLYRELEGRLARLGFPRPGAVPPLEHARSVEPAVGEAPARICARYNDVRFGGRGFEPGEPDRLVREIRSLERRRPGPAEGSSGG
jgi:transglutaminase-like putative cysteine protease